MTLSLAQTINLMTILFCIAVLVQSLRLRRSLAAIRAADMPAMIASLERATDEARHVLDALRRVMAGDMSDVVTVIDQVMVMRDELATLVELADARADRLMSVASRYAPPGTGPVAPPPPRDLRAH